MIGVGFIARNDAFQCRFDRHGDQRFDRAGIHFLSREQAAVHPLQHFACAGDIVLIAFDQNAIARAEM
jgi:hypothetical protein